MRTTDGCVTICNHDCFAGSWWPAVCYCYRPSICCCCWPVTCCCCCSHIRILLLLSRYPHSIMKISFSKSFHSESWILNDEELNQAPKSLLTEAAPVLVCAKALTVSIKARCSLCEACMSFKSFRISLLALLGLSSTL